MAGRLSIEVVCAPPGWPAGSRDGGVGNALVAGPGGGVSTAPPLPGWLLLRRLIRDIAGSYSCFLFALLGFESTRDYAQNSSNTEHI